MSITEKFVQIWARHTVVFLQRTRPVGIEANLQKLFRTRSNRSTKARVRKANLWSLSRICFLLLPTLTIPFSELSLTGILRFPVFIPSPIGMELTEISISLVQFSLSLSKREATRRDKALKLLGKLRRLAVKLAKMPQRL